MNTSDGTVVERRWVAPCIEPILTVEPILNEKGIKFKPFWQYSLLLSMFFTSGVKEAVE